MRTKKAKDKEASGNLVEEFVSEDRAAQITGYSVASLRKFRSRGAVDTAGQIPGPQYYRIAKKILYKPSELINWIEQFRVENGRR